jgi:phosphate transport system substrate-binding protein
MTYTQMRNKDGQFVNPSDDAFKASAAGADWNKTFYQITTEQPGKGTWPISNPTYILMYKSQEKPASAAAALKFFEWAYNNGDKMADDLDYVPLPDAVKDLVRKAWTAQIKDGAGKPISYK